MRKIIEICSCDVCKKETGKLTEVKYPVMFHTEQTEGKSCSPYISYNKIDMCDSCADLILRLDGWGAQGYNDYKIRKGKGDKEDGC